MNRVQMARFMHLNGTISGGRTGTRWLVLPRKKILSDLTVHRENSGLMPAVRTPMARQPER
jgi:hypothetical protein